MDPNTNPNLLFNASGQTYHPSDQPYEQYNPSAQPYNNSGQPYELYDPTAYNNSGQTYNPTLYDAGARVYHDATPQDTAHQDGWVDPAQIQPRPPQIDVAALLAAHNELSEKLNRMNLQYNNTVNNTVQQQMKAYQESLENNRSQDPIQGAGYSVPETSHQWSAQATPSSAIKPSSF
ncbi:hypothetical protein C8F04DRAFT_1177288 [Mycena alexandri]|uniref:Uncharacterized protein n=1 Tax=Mycena alexandri TaxID=1745969 RepID=A0AAD6X731_9AGAR|nr:hypothetical protein C8F04DRAFT_1177288 [Mycena alexandri]